MSEIEEVPVRPRVVVALLALGVTLAMTLVACGGSESSGPDPAPRPSPRLGGPAPEPATPPARPMNDLERPIAAELSRHVAGQGLDVDYLRCPGWDGRVPGRFTCRGYFDGVVAAVVVRLRSTRSGGVRFDARLQGGLIATRNLIQRLRAEGYRAVDCGRPAAYPTRVGTELVCRVRKDGAQKYVVARITDRHGGVTVTDY